MNKPKVGGFRFLPTSFRRPKPTDYGTVGTRDRGGPAEGGRARKGPSEARRRP